MTSKILFLVLIGCAVAFAGPFDRIRTDIDSKKFDGIQQLIQETLQKLIEKIFKAIPAQDAILQVSKLIDTEEFRAAQVEFLKILDTIYGPDAPTIPKEDQKAILRELAKVTAVLEKLVEAAIKNVVEKNPAQVDGTDLKNAVENLNKFVDDIYAKQGKN